MRVRQVPLASPVTARARVRQHLRGDVSSNRHDRTVASLLCELSDGMVPQIVESKTGQGTSNLLDVCPAFPVGTGAEILQQAKAEYAKLP